MHERRIDVVDAVSALTEYLVVVHFVDSTELKTQQPHKGLVANRWSRGQD